jgi:hypothetical protein
MSLQTHDDRERPQTDAYTAADRYKTARELCRRARADLIESVERDRANLNLAGVARRAGVAEKAIYQMLRREREKGANNGRAKTV